MRGAVKCSARLPYRVFLRAFIFSALCLVRPAAGQLLMGKTGGETTKSPPPLDPGIPTGASNSAGTRPDATVEPPACSFRDPLCVHRASGVPEASVMTWLSSLEGAYERLTHALGLPRPLPDGSRGGGPALDLYVTPDAT